MTQTYIHIVSTPPYQQIYNITNTTSLFSQILHVFHYDCIPTTIISMDNKGTKVTCDRLSRISGLTRILYSLEVINGLCFVSIMVKAIFVAS